MLWLPIIAQVVAGALLTVLVTSTWLRRPPAPLWPDLLVCQVAALWFVAGDAITLGAASMGRKNTGLAFLYIGVIVGSVFWFRVAVGLVSLRRPDLTWLPILRRLLFVWAVVASAFAVSNPLHGMFLVPNLEGRNVYLPAWWLVSSVGWILMTGAVVAFAFLAVTDRDRRMRLNSALLVFSGLLPLTFNGLWMIQRDLPFDPSTIGLALGCALLTWGVYRARVFEVVPVSYRAVLDHDPEAVLICTPESRIGYANPAAEVLLADCGSPSGLVGLPVHEAFDQVFGQRASWVPVASESGPAGSRSLPSSSAMVRDGQGRLLRLETFDIGSAGSARRSLAFRLRDVSMEDARRRHRAQSVRRLTEDLLGLLQPAVDSTDRVLAMIGGAPETDFRLKRQVRSVRRSLGTLQSSIGETVATNLTGSTEEGQGQRKESSS